MTACEMPIKDQIALLYLKQAYEYAAEHSTDPSTQNGAIIVSKMMVGQRTAPENVYIQQEFLTDVIVGIGANHFPEGVEEKPERWERPAKYSWVEHAERNAVFDAAKKGFSTQGATMYVPWFACAECGRAIIQAGIEEVVGHDTPLHKTNPNWKQSIEIADQMFREAGVKFRRIEGHFGVTIRFNGQEVEV
jgi:dCMP deaminase